MLDHHCKDITFTVGDLISLVIPERLSAKHYAALTPRGGTPRVYGGQYIAQAIMAGAQHLQGARQLHHIAAQYLAPGITDQPMDITLTPLREGRSFSLLRTDFSQDDALLFTATLSFQANEAGPEHLGSAPPLPEPTGWKTEAEYLASEGKSLEPCPQIDPQFFARLLERRSRSWRDETQDAPAPAQTSFWLRLAEPLSRHQERFDPALTSQLHQALIGYFSDLSFLATGARPLGYGPYNPKTRSATMSHSMYFHAPQPVDAWYFAALNGIGISNGRAAAMARLYNRDGQAVISAMQEGVVRRQPD